MSTQTAPEVTATTTWNIDPVHSNAEFKVRYTMISHVKGEFKGVTDTLKLSSADFTKSGVEVSLDAATVNTGDAQRDAHPKSADFFDLEEIPHSDFQIESRFYEQGRSAHCRRRPHHPWRDSQRCICAPKKDPWGNTRIGLSAMTRVNRKDFGLNWNAALETGVVLVGDDVTITLDIQFIKV